MFDLSILDDPAYIERAQKHRKPIEWAEVLQRALSRVIFEPKGDHKDFISELSIHGIVVDIEKLTNLDEASDYVQQGNLLKSLTSQALGTAALLEPQHPIRASKTAQEAFKDTLALKLYSLTGIKYYWTQIATLHMDNPHYFATRSETREARESLHTALESDAYSTLGAGNSQNVAHDKLNYAMSHSGNKFGIICSVGGHWTLLAVDKDSKEFRYIDSKGDPMDPNTAQALKTFAPFAEYSRIGDNRHCQQYDDSTCGAWVLHNANKIVENGINYEFPIIKDREKLDAVIRDIVVKNELVLHETLEGSSTSHSRHSGQERGSSGSRSRASSTETADSPISAAQVTVIERETARLINLLSSDVTTMPHHRAPSPPPSPRAKEDPTGPSLGGA